ncbi:MAG TPA: hypothetical protein VEZ90_09590, partial [Blastocatellia bacterium]|nr:hypothetical protein [Blastocatellia bacterium]
MALGLSALAIICTGRAFASTRSSDDAPDWVRQAAATPVPSNTGAAPAIVLLDEGTATVDMDGKLVRTERHVVKVLTRDGTRAARADEAY